MRILDITDQLAASLNMSRPNEFDSDWQYYRTPDSPMLMGINTDSWTLRFYEQAGHFPFLEIDLCGQSSAHVLRQIPLNIARALASADRLVNGAICSSISHAVDDEIDGTPAAMEAQREYRQFAMALLSAIVDEQSDSAPAIASLFALWQRTAEQFDALRRQVTDALTTAEALHDDAVRFGWTDRDEEAWKHIGNAMIAVA